MFYAECCRRSRMRRTRGKQARVDRECRGFRRRNRSRDPQHHILRVTAPGSPAPLIKLLCQIGGGLAPQGWIGRPKPLAATAVTMGAWGKVPRRIPVVVEGARARGGGRSCRPQGWGRCKGQGRIISRNSVPVKRGKLARDGLHFRM